MKYPVLTLTPPWGTLIAIGAKKYETRSWQTSYRGPLLIHQGSNLKPIGGLDGLADLLMTEPFRSALGDLIRDTERPTWITTERLPCGAIIAICTLNAIARIDHYEPWPDESDPQPRGPFLNFGSRGETLPDEPELAFGDYSVGRYAWQLTSVRALPTPIAARGLPGLWEWEGELGL